MQKMCMFANSKECDRADPVFQEILTNFEESNLSFRTMATEVFASPLMTGSECVPGEEGNFAAIS
ncbi:MAG: hypothetical protein AAFY60_06600, partial [Myxococcota bacterium]